MSLGLRTSIVAALALAGVGLAGGASAMPAQGLQTAVAAEADTVAIEKVRLVCPPYRPCFHVPGPYGYRPYYRPRYYAPRYYGPRYYRPYGFYGPYRSWGGPGFY